MPKSVDNLVMDDHHQDPNDSSPCGEEKQGKPRRKVNYKVKYKTEICKSWELSGACTFGDKCAFAHGVREIRSKIHVPANYKTKPCTQFHERGFCKFGSRCQFRHDGPVGSPTSVVTGMEVVAVSPDKKTRSSSDPEPYTGASFSYKQQLDFSVQNVEIQLATNGVVLTESSDLARVLVDMEVKYTSEENDRPRLPFFEELTQED